MKEYSDSTILVTGANGFIGSHLIKHLDEKGYRVIAINRNRTDTSELKSVEFLVLNNFDDYEFLGKAIPSVVIHAAARAHILNDKAVNPLAEYRRTNTEATLRFAEKSAKYGAKRFIFISTIKVNGEYTKHGKPFTSGDIANPEDPYAISKYEAELGLMKIANRTGMEVVIIRPPLVYGKGVKGNFASLLNTVKKGIPLPLGAIHNRRSMVGIGNLVDLIDCVISHPKAANNVYLISDDNDLSTTELLRAMIDASGSKSLLVPVPAWLIGAASRVLGKAELSMRLLNSLQVDISYTKKTLEWKPKYSVNEQLKSCFID